MEALISITACFSLYKKNVLKHPGEQTGLRAMEPLSKHRAWIVWTFVTSLNFQLQVPFWPSGKGYRTTNRPSELLFDFETGFLMGEVTLIVDSASARKLRFCMWRLQSSYITKIMFSFPICSAYPPVKASVLIPSCLTPMWGLWEVPR